MNETEQIRAALRPLTRKSRLGNCLTKGALFLAAFSLWGLILQWAELLYYFPSWVRTGLFIISTMIFLPALFFLVLMPLKKLLSGPSEKEDLLAAKIAGKHFPEIGDELLTGVELGNDRPKGTSAVLAEAALKRTSALLPGFNLSDAVSLRKAEKALKLSFALTVLILCLNIGFPSLKDSAYRMLMFNREFTKPRRYFYAVLPGNAEALKGEDRTLSLRLFGKRPKDLYLLIKRRDDTEFKRFQLSGSGSEYRYRVYDIKDQLSYYFLLDDEQSQVYKIKVETRPSIKSLILKALEPQAGLPEIMQRDNGNLKCLRGTRLEFFIASDKELSKAEIVDAKTGKTLSMRVNGNEAHIALRATEPFEYFLRLRDTKGRQNAFPVNYSIELTEDGIPSIELMSSDPVISEDRIENLKAEIKDDYGFSRLLLKYRTESSKGLKSLEIPIKKNSRDEIVGYAWNLADMNLNPSDKLNCYLEILDNNFATGPGRARTGIFSIRVPSLDELLQKSSRKGDEAAKGLEDSFNKANDIDMRTGDLSNELKKNKKEISYEEKGKIEGIMEDIKKLQQTSEKAGEDVKSSLDELKDRNLLSKETMKKYEDLQDLFKEVNQNGISKAIEELTGALQSFIRKDVREKFQNLKMNEEQFKGNIERLMNLLHLVQTYQKTDELGKKAEEISRMQDQSISGISTSEQLRMQSKITDALKDLESGARELSERMKDMKNMPREDAARLEQELSGQKNDQCSSMAGEMIKTGEKSSAKAMQQKISGNIKKIKRDLDRLRRSMTKGSASKNLEESYKIFNDLLNLSMNQERIKNSIQIIKGEEEVSGAAEDESEVREGLTRLLDAVSGLGRKSFSLSPELGRALADSKERMSNSLAAMKENETQKAVDEQTLAMASLNEAALFLKESMEKSQDESGDGSGDSMDQQMNEMIQRQTGLNETTQGLDRSLMEQRLQEIERLAQAQAEIRKSFSEMRKEAEKFSETRGLSQGMGETLREMEEALKKMESGKIDDDLKGIQNKILSRMLDAQRSLSKRDDSEKRKSVSGKNPAVQAPPSITLKDKDFRGKILEEIMKSSREGLSRDYEQIIRAYFEALEKKK